jgi:hypothetical protein
VHAAVVVLDRCHMGQSGSGGLACSARCFLVGSVKTEEVVEASPSILQRSIYSSSIWIATMNLICFFWEKNPSWPTLACTDKHERRPTSDNGQNGKIKRSICHKDLAPPAASTCRLYTNTSPHDFTWEMPFLVLYEH